MDEDSCLTGLTNLYVDIIDINIRARAGFILKKHIPEVVYEYLFYGLGGGSEGYRDLVILSTNKYSRDIDNDITDIILRAALKTKQKLIIRLLFKNMNRELFIWVLENSKSIFEYKTKYKK
jgi:hypothetical protein